MTAAPSRGRWTPALSATLWGLVLLWLTFLGWHVFMSFESPDTPAPWSQYGFVDFRDTVSVPTRDLLAGGNPYDPVAYRARHPHVQMFNLYLPQHFLFFGWMAFIPRVLQIAAIALGTVGAYLWLIRRGLGGAYHGFLAPVVPALLLVLLVRGPGIMSIRQGQTAVILAACAWWAVTRRESSWLQALAIALTLTKPQLGLVVFLLVLIRNGWAAAARATVVTTITALPALVLMVRNAGGVSEFLRSIMANVTASQADTGFLGGPTDPVTTLMAMGLTPPGWATPLAAIGLTVLLGWSAHRLRNLQDLPSALLRHWIMALSLVMVLPNQRYCLAILVPVALQTCVYGFQRGPWRPWMPLAVALSVWVLVRSESLELKLGLPGTLTHAVTGLCLVLLLGIIAIPAALARNPHASAT